MPNEMPEYHRKRSERIPGSFNVQGYVPVKDVAIALKAMESHGIKVFSASELVRHCLRTIAQEYQFLAPNMSISEAMEIIAEHGLSVAQLSQRGGSIRKMIAADEQNELPLHRQVEMTPEMEERATAVNSMFKKLENKDAEI